MRTVIGYAFALAVVAAMLALAVDVDTMTLRHIDQRTFVYLMGLIFFGMLGFMLITGKGFSKDPRPSKYY